MTDDAERLRSQVRYSTDPKRLAREAEHRALLKRALEPLPEGAYKQQLDQAMQETSPTGLTYTYITIRPK